MVIKENKKTLRSKHKMKIFTNLTKRASYIALSSLLSMVTWLPILMTQSASAAVQGQMTSRIVKLSSSALSAATTSYSVSFNPQFVDGAATDDIKGIVFEICQNSPIPGDACTITNGVTATQNSGIVTVTSGSGVSFNVDAASSTTGRLILTNATCITAPSAATPITFTVTATNPSGTTSTPGAVGSFYARLFTYNATATAIAYAPATPGNYLDGGGVAMSTANVITITAKVQETLTFCVYATVGSGTLCSNYSGGSATAVALGDGNGILTPTTTRYFKTSKLNVSSNAAGGVIVRMKGDTLKSGGNTIAASGATCLTDPTVSTTAYFGLQVTVASPFNTADTVYNTGSCATAGAAHALDITTACSNGEGNIFSCAYGQKIASTPGPNVEASASLEWSAKAADATPAGIYTTAMTFIATGTY
jgi:hypothetical protein